MFATFEIRGRALGAKRLFGWFRKLPWKDARFFASFMVMVIFIPVGAGGIINAIVVFFPQRKPVRTRYTVSSGLR